jgi:uncharacterized membrane protein YedE/YeeE
MKTILAGLLCGLVFGAGLVISGMTETQKVKGFLDILGEWDPSLAVVMGAALIVVGVGYAFARRSRPLFAARSLWPTKTAIDPPLVFGAALFGIGWGLIGFCPGPAITDLSTGASSVIVFVAMMALGMVAQNLWQRRQAPPAALASGPALEASSG